MNRNGLIGNLTGSQAMPQLHPSITKSPRLLILSFIFLNFFLWSVYCEHENKFGMLPIAKYIFSFIAISLIIIYRLLHPNKLKPGSLFYAILFIFIVWSIVLLVIVTINPKSELWPGLSYPQRVLGQQFFVLPYLVPLIILSTKFDLDFFGELFKVSSKLILPSILLLFTIIISGITVLDWEQQRRALLLDTGFTFVLLIVHFSKRRAVFNITLLYFVLLVYLLIVWGRRALLIDSVLLFSALGWLRLRTHLLTFNDRLRIYFLVLIIIIFFLSVGNILESTYVFERGFSKDALAQSRGSVYDAFFMDMDTPVEWIFGRGLGGVIAREADTDRVVDFVESGFLVLLYKGGLLYMIPFVILLLRASYLGLFKSKNDLVKALGILLLIYLFSMYALNWPEFSTKYVLMWISITSCFSEDLRNANNADVYKLLNS